MAQGWGVVQVGAGADASGEGTVSGDGCGAGMVRLEHVGR
jgi:hypothetical protein